MIVLNTISLQWMKWCITSLHERDGEVKRCEWCGIKGHEEKECRKKAAGDPSQAEIRQAVQHIKQQKSSQSKSGSTSFIDTTSWGSAPTLFNNNINKQNDTHLWAAIALVNDNTTCPPSFMLDTCASHHVTNIHSALVNLHPAEVINFGLAGTAHQFSSYEEGDLCIPVEDGSILIKGIHYSPSANHSLLSASCLCAAKWHIDLEKEYLRFGPHKFTLNWDNRHNFPATDFTLKAHAALVAPLPQPPALFDELLTVHNVESPLYQEHMHLSHLSRESLLDLVKERKLKYDYDTLKSDDFRLSDCSACTAATSRCQPHTGESPRGSADSEMVHVDLTVGSSHQPKGMSTLLSCTLITLAFALWYLSTINLTPCIM